MVNFAKIMNFEINHNADGLFENNNKNEAGSEAERTKQAKVIKDFENAFLASFAHYKENPQNRFPGTAHLLYAALYKPDEIQQIMSADAGVQERSLKQDGKKLIIFPNMLIWKMYRQLKNSTLRFDSF